jgi:hypothetical protein
MLVLHYFGKTGLGTWQKLEELNRQKQGRKKDKIDTQPLLQ